MDTMNQFDDLARKSPEERRDFFDSYATKTQIQSYLRPLTEGQLQQAKDDFAQLAIDKARIDDDFSKVKEEFKNQLKPINSKITHKLQTIKIKAEEVNGPVHSIPDYDSHKIYTISDDGILLGSRMMLPEERQMSIHRQLKAQ